VPVYLRCNGEYDCPHKEDEALCSQHTCPGMYRCWDSNVCLHPQNVCDGLNHCPLHDDELLCGENACPPSCSCQGLAYVCSQPFQVLNHNTVQLRYLDATGSGMSLTDLSPCWHLVHLVLARSAKREIQAVFLPNLLTLDLSDNLLQAVHVTAFSQMKNLRALSLRGNPLATLTPPPVSLLRLDNVENLDLSHTLLTDLHMALLSKFPKLQRLNVSHGRVKAISYEGLLTTPDLESLDLTDSPLKRPDRLAVFEPLARLRDVWVADYRLCCSDMLPDGKSGFNILLFN
jgi:hypothetical protein